MRSLLFVAIGLCLLASIAYASPVAGNQQGNGRLRRYIDYNSPFGLSKV